jgi:hypothetical protein
MFSANRIIVYFVSTKQPLFGLSDILKCIKIMTEEQVAKQQ